MLTPNNVWRGNRRQTLKFQSATLNFEYVGAWHATQVLRSLSFGAMARSERFELPTLGFEVRCSIQLSYERVSHFNGLATTPNFLALFWLWLLPLRSDSDGSLGRI
jgi:hypothetical protein